MKPARRHTKLYCSFCGKEKSEVAYLVAGPCVFICNECVVLCAEIGTTMLVENAVATVAAEKKEEVRGDTAS